MSEIEGKLPSRDDIERRIARSKGCDRACLLNHDVLHAYLRAMDAIERLQEKLWSQDDELWDDDCEDWNNDPEEQ